MSARTLIGRLRRNFGYEVVRQRGSHIRLRTLEQGEHSVTVPNHDPVQRGTLAAIVGDVAQHFGVDDETVLRRITRGRR